jgi:hypothetical protein
MKNHMVVISLFDYTGVMVEPWAEAGYTCFCLDKQHTPESTTKRYPSGGSITFVPWDSDGDDGYPSEGALNAAVSLSLYGEVVALFCFAPCDDLAGLGAKHWAGKKEKDPEFQEKAMARVRIVEPIAEQLGCPWMAENPVGALSRMWRKPDFYFNPCEYGGYLPEDDEHPLWPEYIAPRDAYTKKTCIWSGGGFKKPATDPVEPIMIEYEKRDGSGEKVRGSKQWGKLGGKSLKTKNIRSATPRGYAIAVFNTLTGEDQ